MGVAKGSGKWVGPNRVRIQEVKGDLSPKEGMNDEWSVGINDDLTGKMHRLKE